jgi:hypothetical protein
VVGERDRERGEVVRCVRGKSDSVCVRERGDERVCVREREREHLLERCTNSTRG